MGTPLPSPDAVVNKVNSNSNDENSKHSSSFTIITDTDAMLRDRDSKRIMLQIL